MFTPLRRGYGKGKVIHMTGCHMWVVVWGRGIPDK